MHWSASAFLAEERECWKPYEALNELTDEQLDRTVGAAHGWSGRDLMAHLAGWHAVTTEIIRDLEQFSTDVLDRYVDLNDAAVDELNTETLETWRRLPIAEVRRRFQEIPAEFRTALEALCEERWLHDGRAYQWMMWNTMDHYTGHAVDLDAILAAR